MATVVDGSPTAEPQPALRAAARELRMLAQVIIDKFEPALRAYADEEHEPAGGAACTWCPVCAVVALARGENHELITVLARHGATVLGFLRTIVENEDEESIDDILVDQLNSMFDLARGFAPAAHAQNGGAARNHAQRARASSKRPATGQPGAGGEHPRPHPVREKRFEPIPVLIGT
ncbi:hypothetical protein HT102_14690 [Hoyosella sp. G463]|uniref:Uncharacterized protein n=1 Tax=Lolliginicoccus lacisalsi TaxID=2742202 RepID=A0A927JEP4_9ACTN|nr:hypothetical protein [Lolliginicoccus lacisalsi]MBD8507733.1 hypothetical protein [Lolliginicoccus lacisalsi]